MKKYDPVITVCSKCLRSCCWMGEFMCDDAVDANVVDKKISWLIKKQNYLNKVHIGEHYDYWNQQLEEMDMPLLTEENLVALGMKYEKQNKND